MATLNACTMNYTFPAMNADGICDHATAHMRGHFSHGAPAFDRITKAMTYEMDFVASIEGWTFGDESIEEDEARVAGRRYFAVDSPHHE